MKTAVMTDTNSAISVEEGKRFGIYVLPMPVIIDDDCFFEGRDISYDDLWNAFAEEKEIHTSMPSIGDLQDMWQQILDEGFDEIVYIPMSSGLSGSCAAAMAAAEEFDGKVAVVDNHRISYTLMNSVFDARAFAEQGKSAAEIKQILEERAMESVIYITVNSLKYLVKSGRVTAAAAGIANVLHLKPVLQIKGDKLDAFAKARGIKNAADKMIESIRKELETTYANVPKERISIGTAGTLREPEQQEHWRKMVADAFPGYPVLYRPLSCSIACHVGTDAIGTAITVVDYDQEKYRI